MITRAYEVGSNPAGWQFIPFFDVLDFKGGNQPPKQDFIDLPRPGYVRLLQIRDFTSDEKAVYIQASKKWQTCSEEDILIGRYGASVGRVLRGKSGAYNVALIKMIIKDSRINREFLYYWLHDTAFQNTLLTVSRSAQNGFNKEDLKGLAVPVPPLAEQLRIVARIEAMFARTRRARADLERNALLAERFRRTTLAATFGTDDCRNWPYVRLVELVSDARIGLVRSKADQSETDGLPYIRMQHYDLYGRWNVEELSRVKTSGPEAELYELKSDDVLFNTRNSHELVGKVALWPGQQAGFVYNNNLLRLRFKPGVCPNFMRWALAWSSFAGDLNAVKSATTSVAAIYQRDLMDLMVPKPDEHEQQRIGSRLSTQVAGADIAERQSALALTLLDTLEQSILARAFSGELVPQNPAEDGQNLKPAVERAALASPPRRGRRAAA